MKQIEAEVLADPEVSDGGYALIRFKGVYVIPGPPTFMIEPLDPDIDSSMLVGWPSGPQRARASRVTTDGLEMSIGPEIVDCPALEPGLPVAITVPSASAQAELRWPDLPLSPSGRHLPSVMSIEQHAALLDAAERADAAERERALQALADEIARQDGVEDGDAHAMGGVDPRAEEDDTTSPVEDDRAAALARVMAAASAASAVLARGHTNDRGAVGDESSVRFNGTGDLEPRDEAEGEAAAEHYAGAVEPASEGEPSGRVVARMAAQSNGLSALNRSGKPPVKRRPAELARVPGRDLSSLELKGGTLTLETREMQAPARPTAAGYAGSFVLGVMVVVGAIAAVLASPLGEPVRAWIVPTTQPKLEAVLAPGQMSPAGTSAEGVDLDQALQLADTHLTGKDVKDRAEARFWLSKALASILSDPRATWALTQLGTLHATPENGAPDYTTARALWDMAAARGDPVAHCFLGTVFERGLGTPRDLGMARKHYLAARDFGGCPGLEQSIRRVGQ